MKNLFILLLLAACSHPTPKIVLPKRNIVLIQGVHLDDSSWKDVKDRLTLQNFNVVTLNRIGRDGVEPSLKAIAKASCEVIPENSIMVGHSYAGAIINAMSAFCAQKMERIIYIAAAVPLKGEKPFDRMSKADQKEYVKAVGYRRGKLIPKTPKYFFSITDVAYQFDLSEQPKLYDESITLTQEPLEFDSTIWAAIPKSYIFTGRDQIVSLKTQEGFVLRAGITKTATVPTGHFPMLSNPELLTKEILSLVR